MSDGLNWKKWQTPASAPVLPRTLVGARRVPLLLLIAVSPLVDPGCCPRSVATPRATLVAEHSDSSAAPTSSGDGKTEPSAPCKTNVALLPATVPEEVLPDELGGPTLEP